jgi:hypothetical protein
MEQLAGENSVENADGKLKLGVGEETWLKCLMVCG